MECFYGALPEIFIGTINKHEKKNHSASLHELNVFKLNNNQKTTKTTRTKRKDAGITSIALEF